MAEPVVRADWVRALEDRIGSGEMASVPTHVVLTILASHEALRGALVDLVTHPFPATAYDRWRRDGETDAAMQLNAYDDRRKFAARLVDIDHVKVSSGR
jgi:hypothetical protein